jgi:hypothetical protein
MLSDRIDNVRAQVEAYRGLGQGIEPDLMANLSLILAGWAHDARQMEQATVPPRARLDWSNLPAGVIALPRRRPATRPIAATSIPDGAA